MTGSATRAVRMGGRSSGWPREPESRRCGGGLLKLAIQFMAKSKAPVGNMLIAQSGGPTVVINQSLIGAVLEAKKHQQIKKIYGSLHGIAGHSRREPHRPAQGKRGDARRRWPRPRRRRSAPCARSRRTTTAPTIFEVLQKYDVRYFFYIGGNDSAETTHIINEEAKKRTTTSCTASTSPRRSTTICARTTTRPVSAAAPGSSPQAFMGDNLDNRALPGVKINVIMGRHAGFLTARRRAGARLSGRRPAPDLSARSGRSIMSKFIQDVKRRLQETRTLRRRGLRRHLRQAGHGDRGQAARKEVDSHGNVQLSGTGALGDLLAGIIKNKTDISRVRADTFGYLQRSFPDALPPIDATEAREVGKSAVRQAVSGNKDGSIAIKRKPGKKYAVTSNASTLRKRRQGNPPHARQVHQQGGNDVTQAFIDLCRADRRQAAADRAIQRRAREEGAVEFPPKIDAAQRAATTNRHHAAYAWSRASGTTDSAASCVAARSTCGAWPACWASSQRPAQRHQ